jgi:aminoglycoside phosphotransferase (APT) family kinase protein
MQNPGWRLFVEMPTDGKVLLIENSLGPNARVAAELGWSVFALAPKLSDGFYGQQDREVWGKKNGWAGRINLCIASALKHMPFREKSFALIMVGETDEVLKMNGYGSSSQSETVQLILNLWKFLKPGGRIYIQLWKRSFKTLLEKKGRLGGPSYRSIARKLKRNGIEVETVMDFYSSQGNLMIVRDNLTKENSISNLKARFMAFLKSEGMGIVCKKSNEKSSRTIAREILVKWGDKKDYNESFVYKAIRGSGATFILDAGKSIVRMPRLFHPEIIERWSRNFEALRALRSLPLPFRIPEVIFVGKVGEQPYSVESKLFGDTKEGNILNNTEFENLSIQVVETLVALFQTTSRIILLDEEQFKRLFEDPIDRLLHYCDENGKEQLKGLKRRFKEDFLYREFPLIRTHGDFKRSNFIFGKEDRLEGIFDWDLSLSAGLPLLDLYLFLGFEKANASKRDFCNTIFQEFIKKSPLNNDFVSQYLKRTYWVDEFRAKSLAFLLIIYYLTYHGGLIFNQVGAREFLDVFFKRNLFFLRDNAGNRENE